MEVKDHETEEVDSRGEVSHSDGGVKEKRSVAEICRDHQISQTLYYRWRDRFLEAGKRGLANGASDDHAYGGEIEKLQQIIGKQAIQIEILKKTEELFGRRQRRWND